MTATEAKLRLQQAEDNQIYVSNLEEENRKLKEKIDELEKCNLNLQERLDRKEEVNKKLREELSAYDREYFDEDKKAKNIYIDKS
jgi:predicted RNase H-like nuclease (RuvC/YqgF family)